MSKTKSESWYLKQLLKDYEIEYIENWIKKNPMPKDWQCGKYAWAYTEMT